MIRTISLSLGLALLAAGCSQPAEVPATGDAAGSSTQAPAPEVQNMADVSTSLDAELGEEADRLLESASLGIPGRAGIEPKESFSRSDNITLAITAAEVPEGLVGRVKWLDSEGKVIAEDQIAIPATRSVRFAMPAGLRKPGSYVAEAYLGGNLVQQFPFTIGE